MKRAIDLCVFSTLAFMLLMSIVPHFVPEGDALYPVLYLLCFVIPTALVLPLSQKRMPSFGIFPKKEGLLLSLPLIFPIVVLTAATSYLTSRLFSLSGIESSSTLTGGVSYIILIYVVLAAVGEELLFRFVPLKLLGAHSRRSAIIVSALLFAATHANFRQIPHALVAGLGFALVGVLSGGILPSVLAHLINNALSVALTLTPSCALRLSLAWAFLALTLLSVCVIIFKRKEYVGKMRAIFAEEGAVLTPSMLVFLIATLGIAALALLPV